MFSNHIHGIRHSNLVNRINGNSHDAHKNGQLNIMVVLVVVVVVTNLYGYN